MILVAYDTLARNSYIALNRVEEIKNLIKGFNDNADSSLKYKIEDTINILNLIDPKITQ